MQRGSKQPFSFPPRAELAVLEQRNAKKLLIPIPLKIKSRGRVKTLFLPNECLWVACNKPQGYAGV